MADKIDIEIDAKILYEMYEYAAYAKTIFRTEIAGWGHFNRDHGIYKLAPLPKQIVSGAEVETFPDAMYKDQSYDISDMTVQWHSHVDMGVTPSWTDKKMIEDALELYPYLISIIVNCKNEYYAELNIKRTGEILLAGSIKLEVNLVPYYDNPVVKKIVKKQCRKPQPVIIKTTETQITPGKYYGQIAENQSSLRAWHPKYGMGLYTKKNFYPESGKFYIKDVNWNPLIGVYDNTHKGETLVSVSNTNKDEKTVDDYSEYLPFIGETVQSNPATTDDSEPNDLEQRDMDEIKKRAIELDKQRKDDFSLVCAAGVWWIQHTKSNHYCEIDYDYNVINVDGEPGTWNEFLKLTGALESDFWYNPGDCIACNASGKSSKGEKCKACEGTGKIKINA